MKADSAAAFKWLEKAAVRTGQAELGRSELATAFARSEDDED